MFACTGNENFSGNRLGNGGRYDAEIWGQNLVKCSSNWSPLTGRSCFEIEEEENLITSGNLIWPWHISLIRECFLLSRTFCCENIIKNVLHRIYIFPRSVQLNSNLHAENNYYKLPWQLLSLFFQYPIRSQCFCKWRCSDKTKTFLLWKD